MRYNHITTTRGLPFFVSGVAPEVFAETFRDCSTTSTFREDDKARLSSEQIVIVRKAAQKAEVQRFFTREVKGATGEMQDVPALTTREAKGLEFQDVILWKCIGSIENPCWQFVYDYLKKVFLG